MIRRITSSLLVSTMSFTFSGSQYRVEFLGINEIKDSISRGIMVLKKVLWRRLSFLGDSSWHYHLLAMGLGKVACLGWAHFLISRMRDWAGQSFRSLSLCVYGTRSCLWDCLLVTSPYLRTGYCICMHLCHLSYPLKDKNTFSCSLFWEYEF